MVTKQVLMASLLISVSGYLWAANTDTDEKKQSEITVTSIEEQVTSAENDEPAGKADKSDEPSIDQEQESIFDTLNSMITPELKLATLGMVGSATYLGNSVGRLGLMGWFSYKSLKNFRKAFQYADERSYYLSKSFAYLCGMLMLVQDGSWWLKSIETK